MSGFTINDFEGCKNICVAGISSKEKFGNMIYKHLEDSGFTVSGLGRNNNSSKIFKSLKDVIVKPELVIFAVKAVESMTLLRECAELGIKKVFFVSGSYNKEIIEFCKKNSISAIYKSCPFMHFNSNSFHKFHKNIRNFFGIKPHII